jgi:uncharacterized protein
MKAVIVGGTGLIGSALAASLATDGWETVVLTRSDVTSPSPAGVRQVSWLGKQDPSNWVSEISGAGAVYNLAGANIGEALWSAARKELLLASRLRAGAALTQAIQGSSVPPQVLIQASAVGIYGASGDLPITENQPPGSGFLAEIAQAWENSTAGVAARGVRRVIVRTGVVLSRQGGALPKLAMPFWFGVGGPLGSGRQFVPWIHIMDEVRALRFVAESPDADGVYNLCSPNPVTNSELAHTLGRVLRRPALIPAPAFALRLLLGEMSTIVLDGQRQLPARLLEEGFPFLFPDLDAALRELYDPRKRA